MMKLGLSPIILASLSLFCSQVANAANDENNQSVLETAAKEIKKGNAKAAYKLLLPLQEQKSGQVDFDFVFGLSALENRKYGEAIVAFQRVLAVQPDHVRAQAELARAYAMAGDIDTARAEFATVRGNPSIPDPVRNRIDGVIRKLDTAITGGASQISGFVDVEGGFDSNINTATDAVSITLPLFAFLGPASLNGTARKQEASFYQIQGGVSASTPLGRQTRLFGSALGNWRDNVNNRFMDQASIVGTVGAAHSFANRDVISVSTQVQRFWLGHAGYRTSVGGDVRYTKHLPNGAALSLSGQYFRLDYDASPLRNADRFSASLSYADNSIYGGVGGGKEETRRNGADQLSYVFLNAQFGGEWAVAPKTSFLAGISVEHRNHDAQDPLFLSGRRDMQYNLSVGVRYRVSGAISIRPRVTYTRNESNLSLYDYDRWTASIGARLSF